MQIKPILKTSPIFKDIDARTLSWVARKSQIRPLQKGEQLFQQQEACRYVYLVVQGLIKVYATSKNGTRMTFLMARPGEPLNLITPLAGRPRPVVAEAMKNSVVAALDRDIFLAVALDNPVIITNIIALLGRAMDSSHLRIMDMMEKKVDERLSRTLFSLYRKFGTPLNFTSIEIAGIVGTTTESVLRAMGRLKKADIIVSSRGRIEVKNPKALEKYGIESLWI